MINIIGKFNQDAVSILKSWRDKEHPDPMKSPKANANDIANLNIRIKYLTDILFNIIQDYTLPEGVEESAEDFIKSYFFSKFEKDIIKSYLQAIDEVFNPQYEDNHHIKDFPYQNYGTGIILADYNIKKVAIEKNMFIVSDYFEELLPQYVVDKKFQENLNKLYYHSEKEFFVNFFNGIDQVSSNESLQSDVLTDIFGELGLY